MSLPNSLERMTFPEFFAGNLLKVHEQPSEVDQELVSLCNTLALVQSKAPFGRLILRMIGMGMPVTPKDEQ